MKLQAILESMVEDDDRIFTNPRWKTHANQLFLKEVKEDMDEEDDSDMFNATDILQDDWYEVPKEYSFTEILIKASNNPGALFNTPSIKDREWFFGEAGSMYCRRPGEKGKKHGPVFPSTQIPTDALLFKWRMKS